MKWVKLTLLEAQAILDAFEIGHDYDCQDEAAELLQAAIDNAVDEEIPNQ